MADQESWPMQSATIEFCGLLHKLNLTHQTSTPAVTFDRNGYFRLLMEINPSLAEG
jgi:hypothetical protein